MRVSNSHLLPWLHRHKPDVPTHQTAINHFRLLRQSLRALPEACKARVSVPQKKILPQIRRNSERKCPRLLLERRLSNQTVIKCSWGSEQRDRQNIDSHSADCCTVRKTMRKRNKFSVHVVSFNALQHRQPLRDRTVRQVVFESLYFRAYFVSFGCFGRLFPVQIGDPAVFTQKPL